MKSRRRNPLPMLVKDPSFDRSAALLIRPSWHVSLLTRRDAVTMSERSATVVGPTMLRETRGRRSLGLHGGTSVAIVKYFQGHARDSHGAVKTDARSVHHPSSHTVTIPRPMREGGRETASRRRSSESPRRGGQAARLHRRGRRGRTGSPGRSPVEPFHHVHLYRTS